MTYWMSKEMNRCFECRKIFYVAVVTIILVVIHENQNCLFDEIPVHMRGVINYLLFLGIKYLTFFLYSFFFSPNYWSYILQREIFRKIFWNEVIVTFFTFPSDVKLAQSFFKRRLVKYEWLQQHLVKIYLKNLK